MSKPETTAAQKEQIVALCQRRKARRLTWLHKTVRNGPEADSEAALLIEFNPSDIPPLTTLAAMEAEISRILGCQTDLHLYLREMYLGYGPSESGIVYDRADYMDIPLPIDKIAEFCKRKQIRWLAKLPHPNRSSVIDYADVGFLAGLAPDTKLSWYAIDGAEELNEILGCEAAIDFADEVPSDLEVLYRDAAAFQSSAAH